MSRSSRAAVVLSTVSLLLTLAPARSMAEASPEQGAGPVVAGRIATVAPGEYEVTLVTGDRVVVDQYPDGRTEINLDPAARGGAGVEIEWVDAGDDFYVLPSDARGLVGDQLDIELFNVAELIRSGFHAGGTGYLPVIVTYQEPAAARHAAAGDRRRTTTAPVGTTSVAGTSEQVGSSSSCRPGNRPGPASCR